MVKLNVSPVAVGGAKEVVVPLVSILSLGKFRMIATLSVALVVIPFLTHICQVYLHKIPRSTSLLWVISFAINIFTVGLPGRFDSNAGRDNSISTTEGGPWTSFFAPAPWAFAIWGVIYLSEILQTVFVGLNIPNYHVGVLKKVLPFWMCANLYQSLWCLSFREVLKDYLWLPALLLGLAATSLSFAHRVLSIAIDQSQGQSKSSILGLMALRLPISLHTGWLAAATLLNLNGWQSYQRAAVSTQISLAFGSVYAAVVLGLGLGIPRSDPWIILTVAWALAALADKTLSPAASDRKPEKGPQQIEESRKALGITESIASKFMALVGGVAFIPFIKQLF